MNKKHIINITYITIFIIIAIALYSTMASATTTITWLSPNYKDQVLDEYPQTIRYYANSDNTITTCNTTLGNKSVSANVNTGNAEIYMEVKLAEGYYNVTTTCTDGDGDFTSTQELRIDDMATYNKRQERNFLWTVWLVIFISLLIVYLITKKMLIRVITSGAMLATSIGLTQITKQPIIWIPIMFSVILIIMGLTKTWK